MGYFFCAGFVIQVYCQKLCLWQVIMQFGIAFCYVQIPCLNKCQTHCDLSSYIHCCAVIKRYNMPYHYTQYIILTAKHKANFELTKHTSYLDLMAEIWGVCCDNFRENDRVLTASHCDALCFIIKMVVTLDWFKTHLCINKINMLNSTFNWCFQLEHHGPCAPTTKIWSCVIAHM